MVVTMSDELVFKLTAEVFKSLAHPVRLKILKMLSAGERCVCEIIPEAGIEQSNLSQHLGILKKQGIVDCRKEGTKVIYFVLYPAILQVVSIVENILLTQLNKSQNLLKHLNRTGGQLGRKI
jgi:ArsR family transcriptional regulator